MFKHQQPKKTRDNVEISRRRRMARQIQKRKAYRQMMAENGFKNREADKLSVEVKRQGLEKIISRYAREFAEAGD